MQIFKIEDREDVWHSFENCPILFSLTSSKSLVKLVQLSWPWRNRSATIQTFWKTPWRRPSKTRRWPIDPTVPLEPNVDIGTFAAALHPPLIYLLQICKYSSLEKFFKLENSSCEWLTARHQTNLFKFERSKCCSHSYITWWRTNSFSFRREHFVFMTRMYCFLCIIHFWICIIIFVTWRALCAWRWKLLDQLKQRTRRRGCSSRTSQSNGPISWLTKRSRWCTLLDRRDFSRQWKWKVQMPFDQLRWMKFPRLAQQHIPKVVSSSKTPADR